MHKDYLDKCSKTGCLYTKKNTASQFIEHSAILEASGLLVAAAFGFVPRTWIKERKPWSEGSKAVKAI